ncbi:MAG: hypothetical protein ABIP11_00305, partial [Luteimonas sp.]
MSADCPIGAKNARKALQAQHRKLACDLTFSAFPPIIKRFPTGSRKLAPGVQQLPVHGAWHNNSFKGKSLRYSKHGN